MPHRMLRPAAVVLLASAPLFAAVPAQATAHQNFPCYAALQKISNATTSRVTLTIGCDQTRTLDVRITAGGTELANLQQTVQAGVQRGVTFSVPRVPQVCAVLKTGGMSHTSCTP